jgi:hypothetical protein
MEGANGSDITRLALTMRPGFNKGVSLRARRIALKINTFGYDRSDIYPADNLRNMNGGTVSAIHLVILTTARK